MGWLSRVLGRQPTSDAPAEPDEAETPAPVLYVPSELLTNTHRHLMPHWRAGVEAACLWFGVEKGSVRVATTLALPVLLQSAGNYRMEPSSLRCIAAQMRKQGLIAVAQVHTHPAAWVGHSRYDDERAYSTRDASLSLVWPHYGHAVGHDLEGIGVHERRNGRWEQLRDEEVGQRVRVVDSLADHRWEIRRADLEDEA